MKLLGNHLAPDYVGSGLYEKICLPNLKGIHAIMGHGIIKQVIDVS